MTVQLSCAFATSMDTPDHAALAERLGYRRAWLYDSPALYPDVWATLVRCAERTSTIGLGPAVLVPSLRHPMTTAAAIATLVDLAGAERVAVAVGTGFTGRFALGRKPLRWARVADYVRTVQALLGGETTDWEGARIRMLHAPGFGARRPIRVPFLLGAAGPKGIATAREVGADGVFLAGGPPVPGFDWEATLFFGTVLDDGEESTAPRVTEAAGHGAAVLFHFWSENGRDLAELPGGEQWAAAYADVPAAERHLAMHDLHLVGVNERDRDVVTPQLITALGMAMRPHELRDRLAQLERDGVTEVAYQPAGPDIPRELEAFAAAVG